MPCAAEMVTMLVATTVVAMAVGVLESVDELRLTGEGQVVATTVVVMAVGVLEPVGELRPIGEFGGEGSQDGRAHCRQHHFLVLK